jgi:Zn-dependent protease with chaperone function
VHELVRASDRIELHLLYASFVWLAAWLLTSTRRGSATAKYWIWVATSLFFVLPLGSIPTRLWPHRAATLLPHALLATALDVGDRALAVAWTVWAIGAAVMLVRLAVRITQHETASAPAVHGLLRPRIALPAGIERVLTPAELDAVLAHELRHARRRDNLIRLLYELALCALWFHPLLWLAGSRLALYRELSCDESVADGASLVTALAKLTGADAPLPLHASASAFLLPRLEYLSSPPRPTRMTNVLVALGFAAVLVAGTIETVTACTTQVCSHR